MTITALNETHRRRLKRLRDIMREVGKRELAMSDWFTPLEEITDEAAANLSTVDIALSASEDCGFAACAMGHACMDPVLQAEGLRVVGRAMPMPSFREANPDHIHRGFEAAQAFFGLTDSQSKWLFSPQAYDEELYERNLRHEGAGACIVVPGDDVADRIEVLLNGATVEGDGP